MLHEKAQLFTLRSARLRKYLLKEHQEIVLGEELHKTAQRVVANVGKANAATSKEEERSKLIVARGKLNVASMYIDLMHEVNYMTGEQFRSMNRDLEEIGKLLQTRLGPNYQPRMDWFNDEG